MKTPTLAQGNQIINLILQKKTPADQLQNLFESGLLSDILDANPRDVNRKKFRIAIGLDKPPEEKLTHRLYVPKHFVDQELVEKMMKKEIGNVKILEWKAEHTRYFFDPLTYSGGPELPWHDTVILVHYVKK